MTTTTYAALSVPSPGQRVVSVANLEPEELTGLEHWVGDQLRRGSDTFALTQVTLASRQAEAIDEWDGTIDLDPQQLARMIYDRAVSHARTLEESLAFVVIALRPGFSQPASRYSFRIEGERGRAVASASTTPEDRSLLAMLMEHSERASRMSVGQSREIVEQYRGLVDQSTKHWQDMLAHLQRRIGELEERETRSRERDLEGTEMRRQLVEGVAVQKYEFEKLKGDQELRNRVLEQGMAALSTIAAMAAGKLAGFGPGAAAALASAVTSSPHGAETSAPGVGETEASASGGVAGAARLEEVIVQVITSLTSEQTDQLLALLRPEQVALFVELFALIQARRAGASPEAAPDPTAAASLLVEATPPSAAAAPPSAPGPSPAAPSPSPAPAGAPLSAPVVAPMGGKDKRAGGTENRTTKKAKTRSRR